jgi:hypothetical protein
MRRTKTSVFVSYSHKDQKWLERLLTHLSPLQRNGSIDVWSDKDIRAGASWRKEITQALDKAAVAVLLISADFLASDFVMVEEVPRLLRSAESKGTAGCRTNFDRRILVYQSGSRLAITVHESEWGAGKGCDLQY